MARPPPKPEFQAPDEITSVYPIGLLTKSEEGTSPPANNLGFTPLPALKSSGKAAQRTSASPSKASPRAAAGAGGVSALYLVIALLAGGLLALILGFSVAILILL